MRGVYIRAIASAVKDSTGLDFRATDLNFNLLKGRANLFNPTLDTDFFKADEIEVVVNTISLFGTSPHIKKLIIVNPVSNISAKHLERIKLKPSDGPAPNWKLDKLEISNGSIFINEPEWGLPRTEITFKASAAGPAPKTLNIEAECSRIVIANEPGALQGSANFLVDIKADMVELRQMNFDSELLKIKANGAFNTENNAIGCEAGGAIFSQNLSEVFGAVFSGFDGRIDFSALLSGQANNPEWILRADAKNIKTPYHPVDNFMLEAYGDASGIDLRQFRLRSGASLLTANGPIKDAECELIFDGRAMPLKPLSDIIRTPILEHVSADIIGMFSSAAPIWSVDAFREFQVDLSAVFNRNENHAGDLVITAAKNKLLLESFNINIPEIKISASGAVDFKTHNNAGLFDFSITSLNLNAETVTSAELVANFLDNWKIVDLLPISGETRAKAHVTWSPSADLRLDGFLKLKNPVYYGATADTLMTDVRIDSKQLFLDDIRLNRNEAEAKGHLWLSWDDLPSGADQISMRYESSGLPLAEGLETGISDIEILKDMAAWGLASGWVELKGPYDSMVLSGEARLVDGSIYGVSIPAFSGAIEMALNESNLHLVIPEFRLADARENLESLNGALGLKGGLDIDLTAETWTGRIAGAIDSHALGMTGAPRVLAQLEAVFDGPYAASYGPIALPEGAINLTKGQVFIDGDVIDGLMGDISVKNGLIQGVVKFQDFKNSRDSLIELDASRGRGARSERDNLRWRLRVAFLPETAHTERFARSLTNGALEDIRLNLFANGRLNDSGVSWNANIDTFEGKYFGLDFKQQQIGAIRGDSDSIKFDLDLGSQDFSKETREPLSQFRLNGTLPLGNKQAADITLVGKVDLEEARDVLAGAFGMSKDDLLAGFTPLGVGIMDMRLYGLYEDINLDGVLQIRGGRLKPQDNFPYSIENLNVDLICDGRSVVLKNLHGRMARGILTADGNAVWNNNGVESYELHTRLDDFYYNFIPEGFNLSGSLDAMFYNLPDGKSEIRGTLKANNMSYAAEIDLRKIILNNSVVSVPSLKNIEWDDPMDNIRLNLDVALNQPWSFDTNLMKFKGMPSDKFKILGTLANPGLRGRMEFIPGGRVTNILPAGDIIIEKGSIDFPDASVFNPVLDIQGQVDIVPFRVHLNIQGPLDTLNMSPTSTPTLRQDEVISLLLNPAIAPTLGNSAFSGSLSSSSTASAGLADTAGGLITNLMLTSIQEQFRRALKLDRVSVAWRTGIGGSSETDVVIGKNLIMRERMVPVIGSYRASGDIVTIGGQIEWRMGNLVIHFGASGSRGVQLTPSGEIRYSWSSW